MKLRNALATLFDMYSAVRLALVPTISELLKTPSRFLRPAQIRREFMAQLWILGFGNGIDANDRPSREALLTPNARGVVLDVGAGHGHVAKYLDREKVTKYIAMEPNTAMHDEIGKLAGSVGFTEADGSLVILPYGAEQIALLVSALGKPESVDTLVSVLSLCSVPEPINTIQALVDRLLKPGGQFLFIEHVRSPRVDVAWWQAFWAPFWRNIMDGCTLGRPTDVWIDEMDVWETKDPSTVPGLGEEHMFWRRMGRYVKRS